MNIGRFFHLLNLRAIPTRPALFERNRKNGLRDIWNVQEKFATQEKDAAVWRNTCLGYFQKFSKMPIPEKLKQ
jgi:hypothetical protein